MHTWFHIIDRVIPGVGKLVVAKEVAADMVIVAPAMNLGFFIVTKSMELSDAVEIASANLQPTLVMSYKVWPVANLIPISYSFRQLCEFGVVNVLNKKSENTQDVEDVVNG